MEKLIIDESSEFEDDLENDVLFKDSSSFSQFIERKSVIEDETRMQTILNFCEERVLDIDDITHLISSQLKEKIKNEMIHSGLMKSDTMSLDILNG